MMSQLPDALENLLHELGRLPGIGRRAAERLAIHLLETPADRARSLAEAIACLRREVHPCPICGNWAVADQPCSVCADPRRQNGQICVIEKPSDLWAFEQSEAFAGRYHVLGGALSPLGGVTADDLTIDALERRVQAESVRELIIATNPSVDGDATAHYLARRFAPLGLTLTRIAQGVPLGGHLDYADAGTLRLALEGRRNIHT